MPTLHGVQAPPGACRYEEFEAPCELVSVELSMSGQRSTARGVYAITGHDRQVPWSMMVDHSRADEAKAHMEAHAETKCIGRKLVSGEGCGKGMVRVVLPALPPSAQ